LGVEARRKAWSCMGDVGRVGIDSDGRGGGKLVGAGSGGVGEALGSGSAGEGE